MNSFYRRNKIMKSKIIIPALLVLMLLLSACGAAATRTASNSQGNGNSQTSMSLPEKLAIGTLKLEGTGNAVTAKQAADLLPLWQVYRSLITHGTSPTK